MRTGIGPGMKRAGDPDIENTSKKPRSTCPVHFQDSPKRKLEDLLQLGGDDNGHIEGKVFMTWPPRNRSHRINLEVVESLMIYRLEVEVPHREGIMFRPHDHICLALKGMQAERRRESSAPHYFPIVLRYPDGVILKYLSGVNADKVIDTWNGSTDEWFDPEKVHTVSEAVAHDTTKAHDSPVVEVPCPALPANQRTDTTSLGEKGANPDRPPAHQEMSRITLAQSIQQGRRPNDEQSGRPSKVHSRKKKRLQKEIGLALRNQAAKDERPSEILVPRHEQPDLSTDGLSEVSSTALNSTSHQIDREARGQTTVSTNNANGSSRENNPSDSLVVDEEPRVTPPRLPAGIRTQRGDVFEALNAIRKGTSLINVIGVVIAVSPEKKTTTNEWSRSFTIVDSSISDLGRDGVMVNCFQKKHVEWLPQVENGDVVILRRLRVTEYNGLMRATGFHDKLRWAVYDASKHAIRPPLKGGAPEKEPIDDGMGYEFSPYWEPFEDSVELEYCRRVAEWWKVTQKPKSQNVVTIECNPPVRKQHLLISEASPDLPPRGFFNCTVEVLQKFDSGGAATVFVTDYTSNPLLHPIQSTWCPPELSEYVLQCDMWDAAKALARLMKPGEYWYFHNIRAKWNPSHYMEGTMQLADKVTHLDEAKLEVRPHLAALLARKKAFGRDLSSLVASGSSHVFPETLLQDAEEDTNFISCTVELLHVDVHSRDGHYIYVTDYTYNPNLPSNVSTADWTRGLDHRIVKIKLDDAQTRSLADDLKVGSMYNMLNLRLRRANTSGGLQGRLGGEDKLIIPAHDLSSQRVQTLLRSKEKWQREVMLDHPANSPDASPNESHPPNDNYAAQDISSKLPENQVRILARVVDFFPFSLEDACVLRCTKCESSPPPSFKQCPRCDDMMESHCKWVYCFYIRLQDEAGTEFTVSLCGKECALLQCVEPADFRCDPEALRRFLQKVEPIMGNLRHVHLAWSKNEDKVIESPQMKFTLESWMVGDEKGYGLLDCVPV